MEDEVIQNDVQFKFVVSDKDATNEPEDKKAYIFNKGKYLPILGVQPQGQQVIIPKPNREVLERGVISNTEGLIQGAPQVIYRIEKIDYTDNGIFVYHKELLFPKKGFPYPEACQANNVIKRAFVGVIRAFSKNPLMAILLLRTKTLEKFLREGSSFAEITLNPFYWKPEYYSKTSKEIEKFLLAFLQELKFPRIEFPRVIAHFFEFDDAYMFRFQDIMNETTKEALLNNPAKEIVRLFKIFKSRESKLSMLDKVNSVFLLVRLMFFVPKLRRAFKKAISESTIENFQMEKCDRYQVLRWDDAYKFLGKSFQERIGEFMFLHKGVIPEFLKIGLKNEFPK